MKNLWGILWRSENKLDGKKSNLMYKDGIACLFSTRDAARKRISWDWGYIRNRIDLRAEPHGWKMPIPVKVEIKIVEEK